jgi:hypothetical protein
MPRLFATFAPTGCILPSLFPLCHNYSISPDHLYRLGYPAGRYNYNFA